MIKATAIPGFRVAVFYWADLLLLGDGRVSFFVLGYGELLITFSTIMT